MYINMNTLWCCYHSYHDATNIVYEFEDENIGEKSLMYVDITVAAVEPAGVDDANVPGLRFNCIFSVMKYFD